MRSVTLRFITGLMTLLASIAVVPVLPASAQQSSELTIAPAIDGNRAVRAGQQIAVSGAVPAGDIEEIRLVGTDTRGDTVSYTYPANVAAGTGVDYVRRTSDGGVEGLLTVTCEFEPLTRYTPTGCHDVEVRRARLHIVTSDGTSVSNEIRIDAIRPFIRHYELIAVDRIRVVLSEPVRHPDGDSPGDWQITDPGSVVTRVEGPKDNDCVYEPGEDSAAGTTGCTRILVIQPVDPFSTPVVAYTPARGRVAYDDYASNTVVRGTDTNAQSRTLDRIRPATPSIKAIGGRPPGGNAVDGNVTAPVVRVGNLEPNSTVFVTVTAPAGGQQTFSAPVADGGAVDVATAELGGDGTYEVHAVARDAAGNRSTETSKPPAMTDGHPTRVIYRLDTRAPELLAAAVVDARRIDALFSELVYPFGPAGTWTADGNVLQVEGDGDRRAMYGTVDLVGAQSLSYRPVPSAPGVPDGYADPAGNRLAALPAFPLLPLPDVARPVVTEPAHEIYTGDTKFRIAGTAASDDLVIELLARGGEKVLQTATVVDGSWSMVRHLGGGEQRYQFQVRARDTSNQAVSLRSDVPDIVHDVWRPVVQVYQPAKAPLSVQTIDGMQRYSTGEEVRVEWAATDRAHGDDRRPDHGEHLEIALVYADGLRTVIADDIVYRPAALERYHHVVSAEDLRGVGQQTVRFEVRLTDLAGNIGVHESAPVVLRDPVVYTPVHMTPGIIEARFPVAMTGTTLHGEWFVDDRPVPVEQLTRDGKTVVALNAPWVRDPNAEPVVRYQQLHGHPSPLQSETGGPASTKPQAAIDAIAPALTVATKSPDGPVSGETFRVTGMTQASSTPHEIVAYRISDGRPVETLGSTKANSDGSWAIDVPLRPDQENVFALQARDARGNVSALSDELRVVHDSAAS